MEWFVGLASRLWGLVGWLVRDLLGTAVFIGVILVAVLVSTWAGSAPFGAATEIIVWTGVGALALLLARALLRHRADAD